jgi:two-component system phosphate regulon sensor histidine kinase PhoR
VERLTNLIQDLDEISKLERGELVLTKTNFIIQDFVKEVFGKSFDKSRKPANWF